MEIQTADLKISGTKIPLFGFGTFLNEGDNCLNACLAAFECGYRHIDTAQMYNNESQVGEAIKQSGLKREEIFITTKLKSNQHGASNVEKACRESLSKLGLDYVDLFLIHTPNGRKVVETWNAVVQLKRDGLIKSAGVSNFGWQQLQALKEAGCETPDLNQIELHIFNQQIETVEYCRKEGIVVEGHCPLARNKRFDGQTKLADIAKKLNRTVIPLEAEVALRWSYQSGIVTIPKSSNPERIKSNFSAVSWSIPDDVMEECKGLNEKFQASNVVTHMELAWDDVK